MLNEILKAYQTCTYDFRVHACAEDPLIDFFDEWVAYYRMKWAIARALAPSNILEIGVRYGYSARAFLEGSPKAKLIGIDADLPAFGGQPGAVDWAEQSLTAQFNVSIIKMNSQNLQRLPGDTFDLIHVDGQQDGDGTFHDLDLASMQARYILVDGYHWTRDNFQAVNEWLWLNKAAVESTIAIPSYAGELLIRTKDTNLVSFAPAGSPSLASAYTTDYYLNDCGGYKEWRCSKGERIDPRLQAVAHVGMTLCIPHRVVDLGAGRGELTRFFAQQGAKVTSIDYSTDAVQLIKKTLDTEGRTNVNIVCGSVLDLNVYDENYDLAVASDIVEHLSPIEDDLLYKIISKKLKKNLGSLVVHSAPNLWWYRYGHPEEQKAAKKIGCWLPRIRRTWYERLMHINEQNPRVLKRQLSRHFPYVVLWFADFQSMGGSLIRHFRIADFRRATSLFAVASHQPINTKKIAMLFSMPPLSEEDALSLSLQVVKTPKQVKPLEEFFVPVRVTYFGENWLTSYGKHPIHLSYHWADEADTIVVFDGLRTPLQVPVRPDQETRCTVRVKAPERPGKFFLRVLPVQEMVRWHDKANSFVQEIEVKKL
ncbi:Methyltransferase type 11 [Desulfobulbus propionicus DSM 2032]|uniref:Methyltransferase type 11 n=1 Tax=Desulfobulbus propionicus (strain ATCC 33891 / DSM 2032 / VKM B-1956 / 1pr3) TaxID=577650 RepID=A0A7U4DN72_DESPD|nr:methyltransferase domain-containing protein [Desulfobulbus propionicus]ADW16719.1 Methyltransferase type 11 [Desulfobulbus propionicus DSM 2032]